MGDLPRCIALAGVLEFVSRRLEKRHRAKAGSNQENAMSNQEWWAAERKAAEFWRKVKENQLAKEKQLNLVRDTAPITRIQDFGTPMRRESFGF
jgi:hypothetical protein